MLIFCLDYQPHHRLGITAPEVDPAIVKIKSAAVGSIELCVGERLFHQIEDLPGLGLPCDEFVLAHIIAADFTDQLAYALSGLGH